MTISYPNIHGLWLRRFCLTLLLASGMFLLCACAGKGSPDEPDDDQALATLALRIAVNLYSTDVSRAAQAPSLNKISGADLDKMHTLRIIILDGNDVVEHNAFIDFSADPTYIDEEETFLVKRNDTKTILFVANEEFVNITLPSGQTMPASDFLNSLSAAAGSIADLGMIRKIILQTADNHSADSPELSINSPMAITAIYNYRIGNAANYHRHFYLHRAAVKFSYTFENKSDSPVTIREIGLNNMAQRQYLFPDADFTNDRQTAFSAYRTPDSSGSTASCHCNLTIPARGSAELPPLYFPEGHNSGSSNPYTIRFIVDDISTGWTPIYWHPEGNDIKSLMTDLPRNTHIMVIASFELGKVTLRYTVCPWMKSEIDIPDFN